MSLVLELMEADLHELIRERLIEDSHRRYIVYQVLKGLAHLHACGVVHRDLKPSNVLLNSSCLAKICDFGMARCLGNEDSPMTENVATRWYKAP